MPLGPIQYMPTSCKLELYQGNSHTYNMINASLFSVCRSHSSCIFPRREGRFQTSLFHRKTSLFPVLLCCIRCHSSKTAVMSVTETLKAARAAAQSSVINWVDLSVALVMVNHHILLINTQHAKCTPALDPFPTVIQYAIQLMTSWPSRPMLALSLGHTT